MRSLIIALSLFTRLPMPEVKWEDRSISRSVLWLPFIGAIIGGIELIMLFLADFFKISSVAIAIFYIAIPIFITGGIHLDGLIDVTDARHSYGDVHRKREILKDAHVGAFGIIRLVLFLLVSIAVAICIFNRKVDMPLWGAYFYFAAPFIMCRGMLAAVVFWVRAYGDREIPSDGISHGSTLRLTSRADIPSSGIATGSATDIPPCSTSQQVLTSQGGTLSSGIYNKNEPSENTSRGETKRSVEPEGVPGADDKEGTALSDNDIPSDDIPNGSTLHLTSRLGTSSSGINTESVTDTPSMLAMLKKGQIKAIKYTSIAEALLCIISVFIIYTPLQALAITAGEIAFLIYFNHFTQKEFAGLSGDLCGWYLCIAELIFITGVLI